MPTRSNRWMIFGLLFIAALIFIEGIWLMAAQRYLHSKEFLASLHQNHWQITFDEINSPFPGFVKVKNLSLEMKQSDLDWNFIFEDASLNLRLLPLFNQEVSFYSIKARNGRLAMQDKHASEQQTPEETPGKASNRTENPPQRSKAKTVWSVKVSELLLDHIQELLLQDLRVAGSSRLEGGINFDKDQRLSLSAVQLFVKEADVFRGEKPMGRVKNSKLELAMEPMSLQEPTRKAFAHIKAELALDAEVSDLSLFYRWLSPVSWLKLQGEGARVQGTLKMNQDEFQPGSQLAISSSLTRAEYLNQEASGIGTSTLSVDDNGRLLVSVVFAEYALKRQQQPNAEVTGQGLRLDISSPRPKVSQPFEVWQAEIEMPAASINQMNFFNAFLPPGTGLRFQQGQGTLQGYLRAHSDPQLESGGELRFESKNFALIYDKNLFEGDINAHLQFTAIDLQNSVFHLAKSSLALNKVKSRINNEISTDEWSGRIEIPDGNLHAQPPMSFEGSITMQSQDLRPLLAIYSNQKGWPKWLQKIVDLKDLKISFHTRADEQNLVLHDIKASAEKLKMQGWFQRLNKVPEGRLLLQYEGLMGGLGVKGESYEFKLIASKDWLNIKQSQL